MDDKKNIEERMDCVLSDMESGAWTVEQCLEDTRDASPHILTYLFDDDNHFLTDSEKNQLLFIHAVLWKFRDSAAEFTTEDLHDLEEVFWDEAEQSDFPFSSAHPKIEAIPDEIYAVMLDCTDTDAHDLTDAGSKWLLVKGFTLSSLMKCE